MKIITYGDSITDMNRAYDADGSVQSYGSGYVFSLRGNYFPKLLTSSK